MHRFLGKTRLHASWVIALLYAALFSSSVLWLNATHNYSAADFLYYFTYDMFWALCLIWPLFFCLTFYPTIAFFTLPFLFITGGIARYFVAHLQVTINARIIPIFFETTPEEASAFISPYLLLWLLFSLLVSVLLLFLVKRSPPHPNARKILFLTILLSAGLIHSGNTYSADIMPYNYLYATGRYALTRYHLITDSKYDVSSSKATLTNPANNNLTVVFAIGESARSDHFSLNGYHRDTSPLLRAMPHLVNFPHATSCEVLTRYSVPCMLTRATAKNPDFAQKETSFLTIFKKLGFRVVWINGQPGSINAVMDQGITDISMQSDLYLSSNSTDLDGSLLPVIQKILQESPGKLMLVVHTRGSHWRYNSRYPDTFRRFSPICRRTGLIADSNLDTQSCGREALVNDYDNSIYYTDYVLSSIITMLKDRNSLFLYSSDHGESLGENGYYLHGQYKDRYIKEQRAVPLFWWASDSFITANPNRYHQLLENRMRPVSHDNIFHSILDCSSIKTGVIDPTLSLCHAQK